MRLGKWILAFALLGTMLAGCSSATVVSSSGREKVKVERVVDGDTFEVEIGGKKKR